MFEISKQGFWNAYEKMDELERKAWLLELRENLLVDDRGGKSKGIAVMLKIESQEAKSLSIQVSK